MWERTKKNIEQAGSALRRRWSALDRRQRIAAGAFGGAVLVVAGVAIALILTMGDGNTCDRPLCVEVLAPSGEEVPPMTPVRIRLGGDLDRQEAVRALQISNEPPGEKRFEGDVLTFRPAWPGFARGERYDVALRMSTEHLPQGVDPVDISYRFTTEGKLAITSIFPPEGAKEIALDGAVMVQFNRSVAPLTVIADRGPTGVVEFDPPVEGEGRWLNTSLYTFRPDPGWAPSTTYTATVKAGLANKLGARLEADHVFTFATLSPAVAGIVPADFSRFVAPSPEIEVTFNQPVDRASAQAAFSLTPRGGTATAGTFAWKDDATFVFRPSAPLALATPYEAVIQAGVQAKEALAVTAEAARTRFETVGAPRVVSTTPKDGEQRAQRYSINIEFSNPMDETSVEDAFSLSPEPEFPPYIGWDESGRQMYVGASFDPSSPYRFAIGAGATDRYGQPLAPLNVSFVTQPRDPGFSIFRSGMTGTFNSYLDPTIMATSWNLGQLDFALYRSDAAAFIAYERGSRPYDKPPGQLIREWSETITDPPLDVSVTTAARLAAPGERLPQGFYYLYMSAPGTLQTDAMPFVVSSANVTTKWTEHDLLVWAVDLQTGAAIRGLKFDVLDRNAATIAKSTTDDEGVARIDVGASGDMYPGYYVSVQQGGITVLSGTNWTGTIGYPSVPFSFIAEHYVGHLYTDRPIYRPGETVQIKGVVRADDDARYSIPPDGADFRMQISDSLGHEVLNGPVSISDMGTFDTSLPLSEEASTGQYYGQLSYDIGSTDSPPYIGSRPFSYIQFNVAEFRKPEFEVEVTADKESYINGETIHAQARADLFFGAPLAGAKVEWQVNTQTYYFTSETFPQHQFGDYDPGTYYYGDGPYYEPEQYVRLEGSGVLDATGSISIDVPADVASDKSSQHFVIEATVTDENGQIVGAFTGVPVHKGAFYLGLRPEEYVSFAGEKTAVSLVTVDPDDHAVPGVPVLINVYERTWRTVRERTPDGEQRYVSEPDDRLVQTLGAGTGADGTATFSFTPARSDEYRIVATARDDAANTITSATSTWVSGSEYASWYVGNDDRIQLVADKQEYAPGDTAKVLVAAPFAASIGLVTQERGRLMDYQLQTFRTNSETIEVPITSDHIPNVYVSVALFKPPTADNPRPQAKYGLVELRVSTDEKKLNISIEPDRDQLGPRETVTYAIHTTNSRGEGVPAEVSLALVDKSVLSLQDDLARPSLEAFWSRRPLGVMTSSMFANSIDRANELTVDRLQGGGKGGGGGPGDETRTFFPNTALWDPDLRTDGNGEATVEVKLPDTLTTWRLTARGITRDTVTGEARNEIVTSKDVIVRPAVPRFLVADDAASLGAIVHNFTKKTREFEVSLTAEGIEIDGDATQRVSIEPGDEALVRWDTHVPPGAERASLRFEAKTGDISDVVGLELPLYAFVTPETVGTAGEVRDEAAEAIEVPYYVRPDDGELTVRVSPSLASGFDTALEYIQEYPWESAETTVSRFLPRLALNRAVEQLGLTDIDGDDPDALVQRSLQRLYRNQNSDGGFGWWSTDESDPAVTAYVLIGFGEARRGGYAVDAFAEEQAVSYLLGQLDLSRDVMFPAYDLRAYMLYAMAEAGHPQLSRSMALAEQRASLSNTAKAWIAIALGDAGIDGSDPRLTALMSDLQSTAIASATGNHWEEDTYTPDVFGDSTQATAQVLRALTRFQPEHPLVDGTLRWLMVARKDGRWESTHDTAAALVAITDFMIVRKDAQADFDYRVTLNGDEELDGRATKGRVHQEDTVVIAIEDLLKDTVNELRFERSPGDAAGRLYYTAHLRYFTPAEEVEALSRGIGVSHEYFRADGEGDVPISSIVLGETVRVRVTLVAESDLNFLVLEDYLPAGLEPIDTTLKTTPGELRRRLYEEQRRAYQVSKRYSPFSHTDIRDNRVALFARYVPKGVYEYTYLAQATTPGEFRVAPATAYEQYFPEVWGRSDGSIFEVQAADAASGATTKAGRDAYVLARTFTPVDAVMPSSSRPRRSRAADRRGRSMLVA